MYPFVSVAYAQSAGEAASQSPFFQFIPLVLILGVFWFLIIRPQQKKQKEHVSMVDSLRKGDKVITNGGIFGTIVKVGDDRITLEIASKVQIQIERQQVARMDKKIAESKEDPDDDDAEEKEVKKKVAKKVTKKVTKKVKEKD
jgi:preprotein translocase subunit YajC|tara:strand:- start:191 stop:619 length:429 start_codon:yes stop_codon:yes gene_type:complete